MFRSSVYALGLALILFLTGCASPTKMAFNNDSAKALESGNPIYLMTANLKNVYKTGYQPELSVVHVVRGEANTSSDRLNFVIDETAMFETNDPLAGNSLGIDSAEIQASLSEKIDDGNKDFKKQVKKTGKPLFEDIQFNTKLFLNPKQRITFSGFYGEADEDLKGAEVSLLVTAEDYLAFRLGLSLNYADGYYFIDEKWQREDNKNLGYTMVSFFVTGYLHANTQYVNPYYGLGLVGGTDFTSAFRPSTLERKYDPETSKYAPGYFGAIYQEFGLAFEFGEFQLFPFVRQYYDGKEFHGQPHYGISISTFIIPRK